MKIHILFAREDPECPTIYGYFSSLEKAEEGLHEQNIKNTASQKLTIKRMKSHAAEKGTGADKGLWERMIKRNLEDGIPTLLIGEEEMDVLK